MNTKYILPKLNFTILLLFVLIGTSTVKAQGFYLGANVGYAFNSGTNNRILMDMVSTSESDISGGSYNSTVKSVKLSLGKGWRFGGMLGYSFNKFIGVEIELTYLKGAETMGNLEFQGSYENGGLETIFYQGMGTKTMRSEMLQIIPTLILSPGFEKVNPYMKIGAVFGFGTIYTDFKQESESTNNGKSEFTYSLVDNGGLAFGFSAAFGVNYSVNEKIILFGEGNFIGMSYAPKKGVKTTNNEEPEEIVYSDIAINKGDVFVLPGYPNYPNNLKKSQPFSSLGFNIGVKFSLNSK